MPSPSLNNVFQRARRGFAPAPHPGARCRGQPPAALAWAVFGLPFLIIARISLSEVVIGLPPTLPALADLAERHAAGTAELGNFLLLWETTCCLDAFANSVRVASVSTLLCLLIGYPMALGITGVREPCGCRC